jgi:hypothetical protein
MVITASTISIAIAVISAVIAFGLIFRIFFKIKNSENITITKTNGEQITISRNYSREQSKKLLKFYE